MKNISSSEFIKIYYHISPDYPNILISDETQKEVSYEEVAEVYYQYKIKLY